MCSINLFTGMLIILICTTLNEEDKNCCDIHKHMQKLSWWWGVVNLVGVQCAKRASEED